MIFSISPRPRKGGGGGFGERTLQNNFPAVGLFTHLQKYFLTTPINFLTTPYKNNFLDSSPEKTDQIYLPQCFTQNPPPQKKLYQLKIF